MAKYERLFLSSLLLLVFYIFIQLQFGIDSPHGNKEFEQDLFTKVKYRIPINAGEHPFPYTASCIVFSCLFGVVTIIICLASTL